MIQKIILKIDKGGEFLEKYSEVKHLERNDIIKNGSIFTPEKIVCLVKNMCDFVMDKNTIVLELGSGYGAFINKFKETGKIIGTEYDKLSYEFLCNEFPDVMFYHENSLKNVCRKKYGISRRDKLLIVGNPPYNDTTSKYRKGQKGSVDCDTDLMARDLGISFLKAYEKLNADYICVLHPLSYIIKKQNFQLLKQFREHYILIDATIFSSREFETIKKSSSEFPVVAAFYKRSNTGMDYEYIRNFSFKIFESEKRFKLSTIKTIDGIIKKYPTKNHTSKIYFYTQRDMNSLMRNKAFTEKKTENVIDITVENLYQYAWLYYLKYNFSPKKHSFIYGNLSPLYSKKIERKDIKNLLVWYAYEKEKLLSCIDKKAIEKEYGKKKDSFEKLKDILNEFYIF